MAEGVTFDGFADLRRFLEGLPEVVKVEVRERVTETTERTEAKLRAVYPPGLMRALVFSRFRETPGAIGYQGEVVSPTDQAHWWEYGTAVRATQQGWNRGSGPAHPDRGLVSIAIKERRQLYDGVFTMLERLGFTVTGTV